MPKSQKRKDHDKKKAAAEAAQPPPAPVEVFSGTQVYPLSKAEQVFPVSKRWFTPLEQIPEEYQKRRNPWGTLWEDIFFGGKKWVDAQFLPRPETNSENKVSQQVIEMANMVAGCYDISAEHKRALVSYILGSFFTHGWFVGEETDEIKALIAEQAP